MTHLSHTTNELPLIDDMGITHHLILP